MIKNLLFDLGGVIMDIRRENAVEALKAIGVADADNLLGKYGQKGLFLQLERGDIGAPEFRDEIRRIIGHQVDDAVIDRAFEKFLIGIPVERLHQLERLHPRYRICMLSNTNPIMWEGKITDEFRKDGHDMHYYFDGIVASFKVKAYKPDPEIFFKAVEICGIDPEETLFYDDSEANVRAAERLGFHGAHVADPAKPFADYIH